MRKLASALVLVLTACSGTVPVQYIPQTMIKAEGSAEVGEFTYEPSVAGQVRSNQVQNTAIGSIYIAIDVAKLVQRATAAELEKAGVEVGPTAPVAVSGVVKEFKADDLGFSVEWTYRIQYTVTRKADGAVLLQKEYVAPEVKTGKFGAAADYAPSINEMVLAGVEAFLSDPEALRALKG